MENISTQKRMTFQLERNGETTKRLGLALKGLQCRVKTVREYDNSNLYLLTPAGEREEVSLTDYHTVLDRIIGNV